MRTRYMAIVEVDTERLGAVDKVSEALVDYDPVIDLSPQGLLQVRLHVEADSLAHACAISTSVAQAATGAYAVACHVMTAKGHSDRGYGPDNEMGV